MYENDLLGAIMTLRGKAQCQTLNFNMLIRLPLRERVGLPEGIRLQKAICQIEKYV